MLKKRPMAQARWVDDIDSFTPIKRLDTGYAEKQPDWPYWVQPFGYTNFEWADMDKWVRKTMGDTDWSSKGRWVGSNNKYWFRTEQDRIMFILRWS